MIATMPASTQLIHAMVQVGNLPKPTTHAERDDLSTFKLGLAVADAWNVSNYLGIIIGSGRRYTGSTYTYHNMHVAWWIDPDDVHYVTVSKQSNIDFMKLGAKLEEIRGVRYLIVLEGKPHEKPLLELLEQNKLLGLQEELENPEGRVRVKEEVVADNESVSDDNTSVTSRRLSDFEEEMSVYLHCQFLHNLTHFKNLPDNTPSVQNAKYLPLLHAPASLYPDTVSYTHLTLPTNREV